MHTKIAAAAALVFGLVLAACGSVKIGRINSDPSAYYRQTVRIEGRVVTSVGLLGTGGYQVDDRTGSIFVVSRTGVPSGGSRVVVTGTVVGGAQILGRTVATAIREERHKVKY